ncbi:hypothetical protein GQ44DRAFT_610346 [Phaeosphaeriaceae sp. PMI808]|nr:hypothetical protein GQ44DRAFT_610346 [Phaeosphaeriaceae sp. PMI808]
MAGFIQNIIWNSVEGFVEAGTRTAGEYAGNALIKAGDMIENGGRGVGNGIEKKATSYGSSISGQAYQPSPKALPSTARKPVIKRSNSLPASNKPTTGASKSVGPRPLGINKYPGGNQDSGTKKATTGSSGVAKSTIGGVVGSGQKASRTSNLTKPNFSTNNRSNSLPKPYGEIPFSSSNKKTAVKPGQPKPFTPPVEQKKAYPGTNTPIGRGNKVPVQNQRLKPLPRLGPQIGGGEKMTHLAVRN